MIINSYLITKKESKELYEVQKSLIHKFQNENCESDLLKISLLHTLVPICDTFTAIQILNSFSCKEFNTQIIGAYLCAESLGINDNLYLNRLLSQYNDFNSFEKSVIKYVEALYVQNHDLKTENEIYDIITESIELCDGYVSNYYFKYLLAHNDSDLFKAKKNAKVVLTDSEICSMSVYELVTPEHFINEKILMNVISEASYNAIFTDN